MTYDKNLETTRKIPELKRPRQTTRASSNKVRIIFSNGNFLTNFMTFFIKKGEALKNREKFYQDELIYHLKWNRNVSDLK